MQNHTRPPSVALAVACSPRPNPNLVILSGAGAESKDLRLLLSLHLLLSCPCLFSPTQPKTCHPERSRSRLHREQRSRRTPKPYTPPQPFAPFHQSTLRLPVLPNPHSNTVISTEAARAFANSAVEKPASLPEHHPNPNLALAVAIPSIYPPQKKCPKAKALGHFVSNQS